MRILVNAYWLAAVVVVSASACSDDEPSGSGGSGGTPGTSSSSSATSSSGLFSSSSSSTSSSTGAGGEGGSVGGAGGTAGDGSGGTGGSGGTTGGAGGTGGGAGGSGGAATANVVINEVVADAEGGGADWVEFYNAGSAAADISGWYFTDDDPTHIFTFANNTSIGPGEYLVLEQDAANSFTFGLGSTNGDEVHLYDAQDVEVDQTAWGAGEINSPNSLARLPNGPSGTFQIDPTPTKGTANN